MYGMEPEDPFFWKPKSVMKSKSEGNSHWVLKAKKLTEKGFESERGLQSPSITRGSHGCQGNNPALPSPRESRSLALHCTGIAHAATRWMGSACCSSWNLIACLYFSFCKAGLQSHGTEGNAWVLAGSTHLLTFGCIRLLKSIVKLHLKMSLWNCCK